MKDGMSSRCEKSQQLSTLKFEVSTLEFVTEREGFLVRRSRVAAKAEAGLRWQGDAMKILRWRIVCGRSGCGHGRSYSRGGRFVREPRIDGASADDHHARERRRGWRVHTAGLRRRQSVGAGRTTLSGVAGVLPRGRDAHAIERLRHQGRSLVAAGGMERQVPGGRQRRMGGHDQLCRAWRRRSGAATPPRRPIPVTPARRRRQLRADHPEKLVDFAYRAVHEMTVQAKAIVDAHYGSGAAAVVLEWLLDRRTAGSEGSAEVSGRLRRHHRRRAGKLHDPSGRAQLVGSAGDAEGPGELHPARKVRGDPPGRAGRLRCARRREGRRARRSRTMPFRSEDHAVHGGRRRRAV